MLETLKIEAPPTRKHYFGVSEVTDFHNFRHMCQGQFQSPHFINFLLIFHDFGTPFWHLGDDFLGYVFQVPKNSKYVFFPLLGGGHLRPLREKGGTGRHLGGIWAKGGPEEDLKEIVPKHMCFSVESGARERFACTRAT